VQAGRLGGLDMARVVKKLAGLDAAKFAGHSLRAGHATSAAIAGEQREEAGAVTRNVLLETLKSPGTAAVPSGLPRSPTGQHNGHHGAKDGLTAWVLVATRCFSAHPPLLQGLPEGDPT
jgi:hypothetical protein